MLASVLEQSIDCVKLLSLDGRMLWMNRNGLCAMEIEDFSASQGRAWTELWPDEAAVAIENGFARARMGEVCRFEAYCPTAKGAQRWWDVQVSLVKGADQRPIGFLAISRDATERHDNRRAQEIAVEEMRHRLKNTYAMIGSIIYGFARGTPDREDFAREMQDRLVALSAAQSLFTTKAAPCSIAELVPALITPFATPQCTLVVDALPAVLVSQGEADAIALVYGELAVNSAKHGALAKGGALHVGATVGDGEVAIVWTETLEHRVAAQSRSGGQGLDLIARIVKARRGTLTTDWRDFGLTVTLRFRHS